MSIEQILNNEMKLSNYQIQSLNMLSYRQEEIIRFLNELGEKYPYIQYDYNNYDNNISMDNFKSTEKNIRESLIEQLIYYDLDDKATQVAKFIILNLDNKGFFDFDSTSFCKQHVISYDELQKITKLIQKLTPMGCASKDTFDFISFQLQQKDLWDKRLFNLFKENLEAIAHQDFSFLDSQNIQQDEFIKYLSCIKDQEIFPYIESDVSLNIIPEAYITITSEEIKIKMNDNYINALSLDKNNEKQNEIYKQNENKFNFLKNMLSKRSETLFKIIHVIITTQHNGLLTNDPHKYQPLSQNMMAETLKLHPSTISRAVQSCYIRVNDILYKLTDLFVQPYSDSISTHHIKYAIKDLIKSEPFSNPFSDETLVTYLKEQEISISRRTVAKYRNELKIKNCNARRQIYKERTSKNKEGG
jgi:RNA polymerase sigma-54 factor